jgi:hypothetical protein
MAQARRRLTNAKLHTIIAPFLPNRIPYPQGISPVRWALCQAVLYQESEMGLSSEQYLISLLQVGLASNEFAIRKMPVDQSG